MNVEQFLSTKLVNYASYDNLRKIGNYIDGFKNASRKVMYTVHDRKIKEKTKVLQLSNKCAEYADYLHGSLDGVVVTLAQDFSGANNIPLLTKSGSFGTRSIQEASAPRYIFANGSKAFFDLFKYEDDAILEHQTFEGNAIEPKFYLPTLPMILINGSEGVSSGFAQKILGRNPTNIKKYLISKLTNGIIRKDWLVPYYNGFNGTFTKDTETQNRWLVKGVIEHIKRNEYLISEIPYQYDLKQYLKILDDLQDNKKIVKFTDESDGEDVLKFRVWIQNAENKSNEELLDYLKLIKPITENFTCIDSNNKIIIFNDADELINKYIEVKKEYLLKRKEYLLNKYNDDLDILKSKLEFITRYIDGRLLINKKSKSEIVEQLKTVQEIKELDNYSYLLSMAIHSLTKEKIEDLNNAIQLLSSKIKATKDTSIEQMWINDLDI